ncbi:PilN family type IVB pilus formation outer membrane protein [Massilia sp.]|uniref:PilN family type IVB pilus formation outer membrane protein n=1 Tax=Massilia sp. TaxID=1882437 RepID=UPI00352C1756
MMTTRLRAVLPLLLLSACGGMSARLDKAIDDTGGQVATLVRDTGHTAHGIVAKAPSSVSHESGIWLGKDVVKLGQPALPKIFYETAVFDKTVASLAEFAERISVRTGLPVKVTPDALDVAAAMRGGTASASAALPSGAPVPPLPGGQTSARSVPVRIYYTNGNLRGLLDTAAARFGVSWKYADGTIQFFHTASRTFQINTLPGDSTFNATVTSGATSSPGAGAGTGGAAAGAGGAAAGATSGVTANNSQNTAVASKLSVYGSIESVIKAMLSSYGKVVISPATGSITVVDTPDTLDRVAAYIENENRTLERQVVINVTVLAVSLNDSENYGINWNLVYHTLRQTYGLTSAPFALDGTRFSAGVLGDSRFAGSTAIIDALSKQGKVRRQTTASVITLNNQVVPLQVAKQTSYLQQSQTTVVPQVGTTTTLIPGTVTSGFNMSILPHVLANGTVLLQFSTDISALNTIREVQSGTSKIETPEIDTRNFLQRVAMKSNETLIISGFEQTDDNLDRQGAGSPRNVALGGGIKAASAKESIVILITPTLVGP